MFYIPFEIKITTMFYINCCLNLPNRQHLSRNNDSGVWDDVQNPYCIHSFLIHTLRFVCHAFWALKYSSQLGIRSHGYYCKIWMIHGVQSSTKGKETRSKHSHHQLQWSSWGSMRKFVFEYAYILIYMYLDCFSWNYFLK